jgi:hypothetical protein
MIYESVQWLVISTFGTSWTAKKANKKHIYITALIINKN